MNKTIIIICCLFQLAILSSCRQKDKPVAETFLDLLNRYEKDSLKILTVDSFQSEERFVHQTTGKAEFIDSFVTFSKAVDGKFIIIKKLNESEPMVFLVEDSSYYLKYLHIKAPAWKLIISTKDGKVTRMISDTTEGYQTYVTESMLKHGNFVKWLSVKYPNETENYFYHDTTGLLPARLKEYAGTQ